MNLWPEWRAWLLVALCLLGSAVLRSFDRWTEQQRHAALLHELERVRAACTRPTAP